MTFDDLYEDLIHIVSEAGTQVDVPIEAEVFFSSIVEGFEGSRDECLQYIRRHLKDWFRSLDRLPQWVQEAEWQFADGKPMVFVGQIDVPHAKGILHDDASFFIFWSPDTGEIRGTIQVA